MPSASRGSGESARRRGLPASTMPRDRVGQVQLALGVARLELLERRPERGRRGRRRSTSSTSPIASCSGVASAASTIARELADLVAHDPAVGCGSRRARRRARSPPPPPRGASERAREKLGRQERRVAGEHEHVAVAAERRARPSARRRRCRAARAGPRPRRSPNASAVSGEATTTSRSAPSGRAASITQSTMRRPSSGCRCFGSAERMRVPRPPAITTAASLVGITG